MIGKQMKGILLFVWEFVINTQAHLNQAILHSMVGEFQQAKDALEVRWFFLYVAIYVFVMWDSYRLATETNQFAALADRTGAFIPAFRLNIVEINYLSRLSPWIGVAWSLLTPGIGHLISRNIVPGLYLMVWHIVVLYQSNFMTAVLHSCIGNFAEATRALDPQWLFYLPSIYTFAAVDAYRRIVSNNRLFGEEQARHLKERYRPEAFKMPNS
ncbi:hypothetical protein MO973_26450 [Paenibacillus sp. TRM 82003]|nr:hypothetical protein [Paenibacillus sp. TRM 82003]